MQMVILIIYCDSLINRQIIIKRIYFTNYQPKMINKSLQMWNPLNYLGYGSAHSIPVQQQSQTVSRQQIEMKNAHRLNKYLIQQHGNLHKRIKQFQQVIMSKSHNEQQTNRLSKIFSQLIHSLESFTTVISQIKQEYEQNLVKIETFDNYQRKIQNHNNIVQNLIESHQKDIETVMQKGHQRSRVLETKVTVLEGQLIDKVQELTKVKEELDKLREQNQSLVSENNRLKEQIQTDKITYQALESQLTLLLGKNRDSKPKIQSSVHIDTLYTNLITLPTVIASPFQFSNTILHFLDLTSIASLSQISKTMHQKITQKLPKIIYQKMILTHKKEIDQIKSQSIYFNHVLFDELDGQNTKINAIKYLFFNHKPGTYILSMFQEDITRLEDDQTLVLSITQQQSSTSEDSSKDISSPDQSKRSWRNFFKSDKSKKEQIKSVEVIKSSNPNAQQKFSLAELKNSQTFKKIEQQLSKSFHQYVFSLKLPKDLEAFGKIMTQQFLQLRKELTSLNGLNLGTNLTIREWTSKLLTLSKFLYLQSQQLWGLSQCIFAKLMQMERQNHALKSQIQDLTESQSGMRKLVEQLAKNKLEMQKRIWQSERKNSFLKSSAQNVQKINEKLQKQIQQIRSTLSLEETKSQKLQNQLSNCKQKLVSLHRKYKQKMEQFTYLKQEISKISWI